MSKRTRVCGILIEEDAETPSREKGWYIADERDQSFPGLYMGRDLEDAAFWCQRYANVLSPKSAGNERNMTAG